MNEHESDGGKNTHTHTEISASDTRVDPKGGKNRSMAEKKMLIHSFTFTLEQEHFLKNKNF